MASNYSRKIRLPDHVGCKHSLSDDHNAKDCSHDATVHSLLAKRAVEHQLKTVVAAHWQGILVIEEAMPAAAMGKARIVHT